MLKTCTQNYIRNMIQRIQSVYLLLVFLIAALMLLLNPSFADFRYFKSEKISAELHFVTKKYFTESDAGTMTYDKLNVLIIIFIGLGALYAVFLYKKTELQKKISLYVSLLSVALLASLIFDYLKMAKDAPQVLSYPSIQGIWPISCAVLSVLAWSAIRRDEKLLRSMDRIR
ncbi:MAG: hypothetical protein RIT07_857 [Bacteroidota bacterium]